MTPPGSDARRKQLLAAFSMPSVATMVSRKSSITNAFVSSIIPVIFPSLDEIEQALSILGMDPNDVRCSYCGDKASEWDHLRPLVLRHRATGYITEIANLVPSCGKCNQSKGGSEWRKWITSSARHSPTKRGIATIADRIARLEAYEKWRSPITVDFEAILGKDIWAQYWALWDAVNIELRKCQEVADSLRATITAALRGK